MRIWTLTDGKAGDDAQCRAIAGGLAPSFEQRRVAPRPPWVWAAPWGPVDPRDAPDRPGSPISPPFPDVLVATGRRVVPYARALRKASGGETFVVLLKNPRAAFGVADVIWAPAHDRLSGANVFSTLTSPHALGPKLQLARANPSAEVAALPGPMLGVILGGEGGGARFNSAVAADLAGKIKSAAADFASVAVTPSRRTPAFMLNEVRSALAGATAFVWDGAGNNPYTDILANAAALIVTAESHNMMSEALASDAAVYAYRPPSLAPKLAWFLGELLTNDSVRLFEGAAPSYARTPVNATDDIVGEIRRRLAARG